MTFRISPDDLNPGTWITIRRPAANAAAIRDPDLRWVLMLVDVLQSPSGPRPGLPLKVTAVDLPFVYVRAMELSGRSSVMEIVDLDEHIVVGCDREMVNRIEDEIHKARCQNEVFLKEIMRLRPSDGCPGQSAADDLSVDPDRADDSDFLDDLAA